MLKIIKPESNIIEMKDMKPLQIGIIQDADYKNVIVMRTASYIKFEVMDLSEPGVDRCWQGSPDLHVKLIPKGEKITIELFNE